MDVIRIRLQTEKGVNSVSSAMRSVYAEKGMRSFYKGYTPAMLSLSPFIAINFATFDSLKTWWYGDVKLSKKELQPAQPHGHLASRGSVRDRGPDRVATRSDTVRRRQQLKGNNYSSTANAFSTIAKVEGVAGFYKGMAANALKVVPNNAIRFAA